MNSLQCLARTEELVRQGTDVAENRIEANLRAVADLRLVDLPADQTFTYEEFGSAQARQIKRQSAALAIRCGRGAGCFVSFVSTLECVPAAQRAPRCPGLRSVRELASLIFLPLASGPLHRRYQEVQRACEELVELAASWDEDDGSVPDIPAPAVAAFRAHYGNASVQAVLFCLKASLTTLRERLSSPGSASTPGQSGPRARQQQQSPIFAVDVQLRMPQVVLNPSLEEIQGAIDVVADKVLRSVKGLYPWGRPSGGTAGAAAAADKEGSGGGGEAPSVSDLAAAHPEVAALLGALGGSIAEMREQTVQYLGAAAGWLGRF